MTEDVIIIGGGVMGASAAYWLTRLAPGLRVLVVERDPSYARAATALSVASVRQQFSTAVNVRMSRFGIDFIRNFADRVGPAAEIGDLGLKENGYLFLTAEPAKAALMRDLAAMQRAEGAATEVWTAAETAARFPWLRTDDIAAASFGPRDEGWFDNMGLLHGLRNAARAQGARFLKAEATGMQVASGQITGVEIAGMGPVPCGAVVNAAGTRAARVMAWAGLPHPVEPRKRTVFVIDAPNARHPDAPLLIDHGFYLRPEARGRWIAATVPQDDKACDVNDFDPDLHLFEEVIWAQLFHRAPGFDAVKVVSHWVGHYDYNVLDQNAILGPHPERPNLFVMSGFSGHGLQQAPAAGRGIAEHILSGVWQSLDLGELSWDRILHGKALAEQAVV